MVCLLDKPQESTVFSMGSIKPCSSLSSRSCFLVNKSRFEGCCSSLASRDRMFSIMVHLRHITSFRYSMDVSCCRHSSRVVFS